MNGARIRIFVPRVPEFSCLAEAARGMPQCTVRQCPPGYELIEAQGPIEFGRKALGLKPAVWYGLFTGGLQGRITRFDRDLVRIEP